MARILIAGGGIGGLAAALAVAGNGHQVVVLERKEDFAEQGTGVHLAPNAVAALDRLGIGTPLHSQAFAVPAIRLLDGVSGAPLVQVPIDSRYRARFDFPHVVVRRDDLHRLLSTACRSHPRIELHAASPVVGYRQSAAEVTALLGTGATVTGDALVGADGIRSAVRRQLLDDGDPHPSGHVVHGSVVPVGELPYGLRRQAGEAATLWLGPGWHVMHYPVSGGTHLNLVAAVNAGARTPIAGRPITAAAVVRQLSQVCEVPRRLVVMGPGWRTWTLADREPVAGWTDRRVTLLGDAAHPLLPFAAQGAAMALEDAVHLGSLLDVTADGIEQRLARYNADRYPPTALLHRVSHTLVEQVYQVAGDAAAARNAALSALRTDDLYDVAGWLNRLVPAGQQPAPPAGGGDPARPAPPAAGRDAAQPALAGL